MVYLFIRIFQQLMRRNLNVFIVLSFNRRHLSLLHQLRPWQYIGLPWLHISSLDTWCSRRPSCTVFPVHKFSPDNLVCKYAPMFAHMTVWPLRIEWVRCCLDHRWLCMRLRIRENYANLKVKMWKQNHSLPVLADNGCMWLLFRGRRHLVFALSNATSDFGQLANRHLQKAK